MATDGLKGIKARVADALSESMEALTMGEIIARSGIDKTSASEVSSALYKLRNQGLIMTMRGPASSANGPRFVRKYKWAAKPVVKTVVVDVRPTALVRRVYNF